MSNADERIREVIEGNNRAIKAVNARLHFLLDAAGAERHADPSMRIASLVARADDAARLAWLERMAEEGTVHVTALVPNSDPAVYWVKCSRGDGESVDGEGGDIREAIDDAMAQEPPTSSPLVPPSGA